VCVRGRALIAAALLAAAPLARAEVTLNIPTDPAARVAIKIITPLPEPPRFGFAPMRVVIENSADAERAWTVRFLTGSPGQFPGQGEFSRRITVPAGRTLETWVYVPVPEPGGPENGAAIRSGPPPARAGGRPVIPGFTPPPRVKIEKIPTGTRVTIERLSTLGGTVVMTEVTEIDAITGAQSRRMTSGSGFNSTSQMPAPPAGSEIIFTIDPATGQVNSRQHRPAIPLPLTKVTIVQGTVPASPFTPPTPTTTGAASSTPQTVKLEQTLSGTTVTATRKLVSGPTFATVREINAATGVVTTSSVADGKTLSSSSRAPTGFTPGVELTYLIDPANGNIVGQRTVTQPNPTAPPRALAIMSGASGPGGGAASAPAAAPPAPTAHLALASRASMPLSLYAEVSGPGVNGASSRQAFSAPNAGGVRPIGASPNYEQLFRNGLVAAGATTPPLAAVVPAELPADWRVWSAFANLVLPADDFAQLDAGRRAALRAWVAFGGQLWLVPAQPGERVAEKLGAGRIVTLAEPITAPPTLTDLLRIGFTLGDTPGVPARASLLFTAGSALAEVLRVAAPALTWLAFFLIIFALVAGPVNLFLLAPAGRRHRLFITTPLISFAAALLLLGAIFLRDGLGGEGRRQALVVLIPGDNQAAVFQEQAALTGFLSRTRFALAEDTLLAPLPALDRPRSFTAMDPANPAKLLRAEREASGEWFRSRDRQAHLLQRLVPTRSRVTRVGTAADGAPIVESSFAIPLQDFVCVDERGRLWSARALAPGQRATLTRGELWVGNFSLGGSARFTSVLAAAAPQEPGRWGAKGGAGELAPLATLDSITWRDGEVVFTGVLEGAAAPEGKK
jgi:hypothetical protein